MTHQQLVPQGTAPQGVLDAGLGWSTPETPLKITYVMESSRPLNAIDDDRCVYVCNAHDHDIMAVGPSGEAHL